VESTLRLLLPPPPTTAADARALAPPRPRTLQSSPPVRLNRESSPRASVSHFGRSAFARPTRHALPPTQEELQMKQAASIATGARRRTTGSAQVSRQRLPTSAVGRSTSGRSSNAVGSTNSPCPRRSLILCPTRTDSPTLRACLLFGARLWRGCRPRDRA